MSCLPTPESCFPVPVLTCTKRSGFAASYLELSRFCQGSYNLQAGFPAPLLQPHFLVWRDTSGPTKAEVFDSHNIAIGSTQFAIQQASSSFIFDGHLTDSIQGRNNFLVSLLL